MNYLTYFSNKFMFQYTAFHISLMVNSRLNKVIHIEKICSSRIEFKLLGFEKMKMSDYLFINFVPIL